MNFANIDSYSVEDGKYTVWTGEPKQVAADASVTVCREQMCFSLSKKDSLEVSGG
jgi:hypothetical protein